MGTYHHKKVMSDYANDKITVEMAVGHILQHIDKLYELQANANANRYKLRGRVDSLEKTIEELRSETSHLRALIQRRIN